MIFAQTLLCHFEMPFQTIRILQNHFTENMSFLILIVFILYCSQLIKLSFLYRGNNWPVNISRLDINKNRAMKTDYIKTYGSLIGLIRLCCMCQLQCAEVCVCQCVPLHHCCCHVSVC